MQKTSFLSFPYYSSSHSPPLNQIVCKICSLEPNCIFGELENLIAPLEKTVVGKRVKADAPALIGPEAERAQEVVKSALRVVLVINNIPEVKPNRNWSEFLSRIQFDDASEKAPL